jgi:hypothetical protein
MASSNYGVFVHLAGCHRQIQQQETEPNLELFAADGMYAFYSRLYSVREALCRFIDALGDVLVMYQGRATKRTGTGTYNKAFTLIKFLEPGLSGDFQDAFAEESFALRTEEVHFWGFPIIDGKIPTPQFLATWLGKGLRQQGLAALSAFLKSPNRDSVFNDPKNFVDLECRRWLPSVHSTYSISATAWSRRLPQVLLSSQQLDVEDTLGHKLGNRYLRVDTEQSQFESRRKRTPRDRHPRRRRS